MKGFYLQIKVNPFLKHFIQTMEEKKILIAGGSGLIGKMLSEHFSSHGYTVNILSRQREPRNNFYFWNPAKEMMDDEALRDVACIINLGGASLAAGRWSQKRKQEIINSRMQSTDFLFQKLKRNRYCERDCKWSSHPAGCGSG